MVGSVDEKFLVVVRVYKTGLLAGRDRERAAKTEAVRRLSRSEDDKRGMTEEKKKGKKKKREVGKRTRRGWVFIANPGKK